MENEYSVSWLSDMNEEQLTRILQEEHNLSERMVTGKRKMDLIDMVCHQQDLANGRTVSGPSSQQSGPNKISIGTKAEFMKANVLPGAICEIDAFQNGRRFKDSFAVYTGDIKAKNGRIIALKFRVNGQENIFVWKNIRSAYALIP